LHIDIARKFTSIVTLIQQELNPIKLAYDPTTAGLFNIQWLHLINVKKTSQFKTQCKGDICHASKTAKITVFHS